MKMINRRVLTALAAVALFVAPSSRAAAQDQKPAVVVSVSSVDRLLSDIGYLTRAAGSPEMGGLVTLMAGQYIQGLDTKKPAGMFLTVQGPIPTGVGFVAVSDFDVVLQKIEETLREPPQDLGNGVRKVELQRNVFFKEQQGWVFFSNDIANLADLPADPSQLLDGLHEKYQIAVRVNLQNIPQGLREMALTEMKAGFERSLAEESDADARALQQQMGRQYLQNVEMLINDGDEITLGLAVDAERGATFLEASVNVLPGSKLARQVAGLAETTSAHTGFLLPDAAATFHLTTPVAPDDVEQARFMLQTMRKKALEEIDKDEDLPNPQAKATAKQIVGALIDVIQKTVEAGKLNGGAALMLAPQQVQLVAGGFVADGRAIEREFETLIELARSDEKAKLEDVRMRAEQHGGVDLHTFTVPVPADEEDARKVFGDKLAVVVGTGPQSVYIAFGKDCVGLLKQVIDNSAAGEQQTLPVSLTLALAPTLEFAATLDDNPAAAQLAEALKRNAGKDHISLTVRPIERGVAYRLEVEEGVLSLIGAATKLQQQRGF